jgi:hypothetical protein
MREKIAPVLGLVLLGIVAGFAAGGVFGYFIMPVNYLGTDISNLRSAQKDDWVIMVSAAYVMDNNLSDARQRISRIDEDPGNALKYVADVAQRTIDQNDVRNARNVSALAVALGVGTPAMRNYSTGGITPLPTPK